MNGTFANKIIKMKTYINQWSYKRLIQLAAGIYFFWENSNHPSIFAIIFGSVMTFQAIANVGCFSTKGCSPNVNKNLKEDFNENEEIDFEEIA